MRLAPPRRSSVLLAAAVCCLVLPGTHNILQAEPLGEDAEETIQLIVMVNSSDGYGAGIVFGRQNQALYIATCDHVVRKGATAARDVKVMFKSLPDRWLDVKLTEHFDPKAALDLAVLRLDHPEQHGIHFCALPLHRLGDTTSLKRGDAIYPVGYPRGAQWAIPVVPDRIATIVGKRVTFQSDFIRVGHSGGALLNERGELIGMIRNDEPPFGVANDIAVILARLREWGYPVQLHTRAVQGGKTLLHLAVTQGNLAEAKRLLEDCFDPNTTDTNGKTPLHEAAARAGPEMVELLLAAGAAVNMKDKWSSTPLHAAVEEGNLVAVERLLSWGAATDHSALWAALDHPQILDALLAGQLQLEPSLLHRAVERHPPEIVARLLAAGMNAGGDPGRGRSPLYLAAKRGSAETLALLLAHGAAVNAGSGEETPLQVAAEEGHLDAVKLLIAHGAEIDGGRYGRTPLYLALGYDRSPRNIHMEVAKVLLEAGADLQVMGERGKSLLAAEVAREDPGMVRFLLEHGADPNAYDHGYDNPLARAVRVQEEDTALEIARLLVAYGGNVNGKPLRGDEDGTLLLSAIYRGREKLAQFLIEAGAELEVGNGYRSDRKPLHQAALEGMAHTARALLAHGARVNARDQYGATPLYLAAEANHAEIVSLLLAHQADPNPPGNEVWQPLLAAVEEGHLEVVRMLIAAGAHVLPGKNAWDPSRVPFYAAARKGHAEILWVFLQAGVPVDLQIRHGRTALHEAVFEGQLETVRVLVNAGAWVNAPEGGSTPLCGVKGKDAAAIAALLVEAGADLDGRDENSRTPLHHAAATRQPALAEYLIKAGADVNVRDKKGDTPLHLAAQDKKGAFVAQVLIQAAADPSALNSAHETPLMVAERADSDAYAALRAALPRQHGAGSR